MGYDPEEDGRGQKWWSVIRIEEEADGSMPVGCSPGVGSTKKTSSRLDKGEVKWGG